MDDLVEFDDFLDSQILKEISIAGGSGSTALILATLGLYGLTKTGIFSDFSVKTNVLTMSGLLVLTGAVAGRTLYYKNHDAAMGVVGAVSGFGLAGLVKGALEI